MNPQVKLLLIGLLLFSVIFLFSKINFSSRPGMEVDNNAASTALSSKIEQNVQVEVVKGTESNLRTIWKATDYKTGEIKKGNYVVKSGDTLWEIAEAVYGNGNNWIKILNSNKDNIGFLSDGSQALIFPGQQLIIP